ncbi:MAG: hypothetical protein COA74_03355 [Gammaproteobacteria bacterium]|nr:MAG: hypothetical protein COA74_03355 [Gammaproteobacteria bacterium]
MKIKAIVISVIGLLLSTSSVLFAFDGDEKAKAKDHMKDQDMCKMMKKYEKKEGMKKDMHDEHMKGMDKEKMAKMKKKHKKMMKECKMKEKGEKTATSSS